MDQPAAITAEQLRQLLEASRLLAVTADLDQLLHHIATAATGLLGCERASIFLHDSASDELWTKIALQSDPIRVPGGAGIVGHAFKGSSVVHVARPYDDPRFNRDPDRRSGFVTRNLLAAPMVDLQRKPVGVIQAINKSDGSFAPADEALIQLLADQAGVAVQRYNLQQAALEARALRREMELAKGVQQALIPQSAPQIEGIDVVGWALPASITGGDCYDLWKTPDGRLGIFLGDATGHGIGPAMVVSQTRTLIRAMCDSGVFDPHQLLACANTRLAQDLGQGQFVTAIVAFIASDGTIVWSSAGHGPILMRADAKSPLVQLQPPAPPLGVVETFMGDPEPPIAIGPGGCLFVSSDGILEAFAPDQEQFGLERICAILDDCRAEPAARSLQCLRDAVRLWQQSDEPLDDQTVVIARRVDGANRG